MTEWRIDGAELARLRHAVFVIEHAVPPEIESDEQDADPALCLHAVARTASGAIVGTGRLLLNTDPPRIGRLAVVRDWRGVGVGTALLETLCGVAHSRGFPRVMLNAQANATAFYYKHGFISHGPESFEAGIPHQEMRRKLG